MPPKLPNSAVSNYYFRYLERKDVGVYNVLFIQGIRDDLSAVLRRTSNRHRQQ